MALSTIKPASIDLSATFAFTGTVTGAGSMNLLQTTTASSSSTITFDSSVITSTYKVYMILCSQVTFSTDGADIQLSMSTDNGSNYPSNHSEVATNFYDDTYRMRRTTSQSFIRIAGSVDGDDSNHDGVMSGRITIYNPSDTSNSKAIHYEMASQNQSGVAVNFRNGNGAFQNTSAVNNIKIAPNNGTIASGTFKLYGLS